MKSGKCVYCGESVPTEGGPQAVPTGLSAEMLMALEGQPGTVSGSAKWRRRLIAFFFVAVLIAVMIGMFMRG